MNGKRKYFLILAIASFLGLLAAIWMVFFKKVSITILEKPYMHYIAKKDYVYGTGVVIPRSEEVAIQSPENRRVEKIFVQEGDKVNKGDRLIQLYNRDIIDEIATRTSALSKAKTELDRQMALPRKEDIAEKEALVAQALVDFKEMERQQKIAQELFGKKAISQGELDQKNYMADLEKAKLAYAKAQLAQIKAGAWLPDLELANIEVDYQNDLLEASRQKLAESYLHAPIDATVLKINIHDGELANSTKSEPLMILGDIEECFVEVAIDENEIFHLIPGKDATGFFRGMNENPIPLSFRQSQTSTGGQKKSDRISKRTGRH